MILLSMEISSMSFDSNNKSPWNKKDGPPDLDKIIAEYSDRFNKFIKGSGGSSLGGGFAGIIGLLVVLYIASGIYIVDVTEKAVVTRFGEYVRTEGQGPHWAPRFIEKVRKENVEREYNFKKELTMLTKDENIADIKLAVFYRKENAEKYIFVDTNPEETLRQATESAARQVVGGSTLDEILTVDKIRIINEIKSVLEKTFNKYDVGISIRQVELVEASPPKEVKNAFDNATKAREEKENTINMARAYRERVINEAKGKSERVKLEASALRDELINKAQGSANRFLKVVPEYKKSPDIVKTRLYYDNVEEILSKVNKVFINEKSNNFMMLPLDKMIKGNFSNDSAIKE